jgi:membrane protein required for colicin V production
MEPHGLNNLDYVVIAVIVLSGLLALMRGFTRELFSLLAWLGAYYAAAHYYPLAIPTMHHYVKSDKAAEWAAMAAVFFVSLLLLMIVGSLLSTLVRGRALTLIDRSLGFLYGLLRGALVVCLIYLGARMILWPDINQPPAEQQQQDKDRNVPPDLLMQAKTRWLMDKGADRLAAFVPKEMIDKSLKGMEAEKNESEKAAEQKELDKLSTPAPPAPAQAPTAVDVNKISTQGSTP